MAQDIRVALTLDNKQFNNALATSQRKTKQFSSSSTKEVNGLTSAFKGLVAAIGIKQIINLGDSFTALNNRLKAVTNSEEEAAEALRLVQQVANATRSDLGAVAGLFADITIASEELGLSQQRVANVATTFSQALKVSGADAGTAAGAIRQFGQALASGVLRGDEFNSINEANSKFMGEFAKALGVSRGELRALAQDGALTAEIMIAATERMAGNVEADFGKTSSTIAEAFTKLKSSFIILFGTLEQETGVFSAIADGITRIADSLEAFGPAVKVLGQLVVAFGLVWGGVKIFKGGKVILATFGNKIADIGTKAGLLTSAMKPLNAIWRQFLGIGVQIGKMKLFFQLGLWTASFRAFMFAVLYALRVLAGLTGIGLIVAGVTYAINALVKAFTGFSILEWVEKAFKSLWGWMKKVLIAMDFMEEKVDDISSSTEDLLPAMNDLVDTTEDVSDSFIDTTKAMQTYAEFLDALLKDSEEAATIVGYQQQALADIRAEYDKTSNLEAYRQALKAIGEEVIDVAERLEGATDAVNDFNDDIISSTNDLQQVLDQLNMNEFERSQDDIKRNLEELRDETLRDLKDELEGLDVVIDATAITAIKDKMDAVTQATKDAIVVQQDLGKEGYDASRTFEQGWAESLQKFIEDSQDGAAKAKAVFDTFTDGVADAFVNFAKTGKLSFKDLLDSMVEMLLRSQIQKLMGTLLSSTAGTGIGDFFSKIFGKAQGGPVSGGTPYLTGERGPEIFVPNSSGQIIPNNKLGGGGTVNNTYITNSVSAVDAKSVAQLFAENRRTLLGSVQMAQNEMPYG